MFLEFLFFENGFQGLFLVFVTEDSLKWVGFTQFNTKQTKRYTIYHVFLLHIYCVFLSGCLSFGDFNEFVEATATLELS